MDAQRFDHLTLHVARRLSRRQFGGWLTAAGISASLGAVAETGAKKRKKKKKKKRAPASAAPPPPCPDCAGRACGAPDGCGGTCASGSCPPNQSCQGGRCLSTSNCNPPCADNVTCQTPTCTGQDTCDYEHSPDNVPGTNCTDSGTFCCQGQCCVSGLFCTTSGCCHSDRTCPDQTKTPAVLECCAFTEVCKVDGCSCPDSTPLPCGPDNSCSQCCDDADCAGFGAEYMCAAGSSLTPRVCCIAPEGECGGNQQCCSEICNDRKCSCLPPGTFCTTAQSALCCSGGCTDGRCDNF